MQLEVVKPTRVYRISNDAVKVLFPFVAGVIQQVKQPDHLTNKIVVRSTSMPVRRINGSLASDRRLDSWRNQSPERIRWRSTTCDFTDKEDPSPRSPSNSPLRRKKQKLALLLPSDESIKSPKKQFPLLIKFRDTEKPTPPRPSVTPKEFSVFSRSRLAENSESKAEYVPVVSKYSSFPSGQQYFLPLLRDLMENLTAEENIAQQAKYQVSRSNKRFRSPTFDFFTKSLNVIRALAGDSLLDEFEYLEKIKLRSHPTTKMEADGCRSSELVATDLTKPLLVLELDDVLIHLPVRGRLYHPRASALEMKCGSPILQSREFTRGKRDSNSLTVYARPHLQQFLEELAPFYTIYVFTRLSLDIANKIVEGLDPRQKYISRVFDSQFFSKTKKGFWVKDLRVFPEQPNAKFILQVDSQTGSFFPDLDSGVPIVPFQDNPEDRELYFLKHYLLELRKSADLRASNARHFQLEKYRVFGSALKILQSVLPVRVPQYYT